MRMEFHEKLQELRKQKGLTQEALAERLYVSRTAISKWESGRGYPNIESLKAIAKCFSVTVDDLLSTDEVLTIAEEDRKQASARTRDLVFGLLDVCMALLLFLPVFAKRTYGVILTSSLVKLVGMQAYLRVSYLAVVIGICAFGILTLAMQNCRARIWLKSKASVSMLLGVVAVLLFMISLQPYAAAFAFVLLVMKALMLIKRP